MSENEAPKPKSKRTTIADLKKQMDGLQTQITHGINPYLTDLAKQLKELNLEDLNKALEWCGELDARLDEIEEGPLPKPDGAVTNVTDRLTALENATGALADAVREIAAGVADWGTRMEDAEDSIHSLQAAISDTQESATHTEPVPLPRPIPEAGRYGDPDALKAVAQVAQTMGDVLHMTRALKADKNLSSRERREIMSIACKAAGVTYSNNLLIRAGVTGIPF